MLSRFCHVRFFATPWTVARQAPLSMGFSRQESCSGLPRPPRGSSRPRDRAHVSYISCTTGRFFTAEPPGKLWDKHVLKKIQGLPAAQMKGQGRSYWSWRCNVWRPGSAPAAGGAALPCPSAPSREAASVLQGAATHRPGDSAAAH